MLDKIYIFGEEILRRKAKSIKEVTEYEKKLFEEMLVIMRNYDGVGLAATQVGLDKQMCVVQVGETLLKLVNPKIITKKGACVMEEGCLSLPGITIKVKRAKEITCQAIDENNKAVEINTNGLMARAIQHEIDHLNGKLIIDYVPFLKKLRLYKQLKRLKS